MDTGKSTPDMDTNKSTPDMDTNKWTSSDFIVIMTYWTSEFLHCFVEPWVQKHAETFSDKTKYSSIALQDSIVFFTQYVLALFIALYVDMKNHKLLISAGAMLIYLTIPLCGIFLGSRPTEQLMLMRCGLAVHVMVKAVRFSAIFEQPAGPNGDNTRVTTAVNETLVSVVGCTVYFVLRHDPRVLSYITYMWIWCGLSVAILVVLISHLVIRTMVRTRDIEEDSVGKIIEGIKVDPRGTQYKYIPAQRAHSALGLGLFLAIVVLFSTISVTEVIIKNAYKLEDGELSVSGRDQLIASVIRLCVVPLFGLLFGLFRGKCGIIVEGSLLALVYFSNIASLYSAIRSRESPTPTVKVYAGISNPTSCITDLRFLDPTVIELIFDIGAHMDIMRIEVEGRILILRGEPSPYFRPKITLPENRARIIKVRYGPRYLSTYQHTSSYWVEPKKQYYFLLFQRTVIRPELTMYHSAKFIPTMQEHITFRFYLAALIGGQPKWKPKLSVTVPGQFNETRSGKASQFLGRTENFTVPRYPSYTVSCVTCACGQSVSITQEIHKSIYEMVFVIMEYENEQCMVDTRFFIISGANCTEKQQPTTTPKPLPMPMPKPKPKPKPKDKEQDKEVEKPKVEEITLVTSSVGFKSLALTTALFSFINFYWCESPNRLRTTILAAAFAARGCLMALTEYVFPRVAVEIAFYFIFLNCVVGLVHVSLFFYYLFYYTKEDVDMDLKEEEEEEEEVSIDSGSTPSLEDNEDDDRGTEELPTRNWSWFSKK